MVLMNVEFLTARIQIERLTFHNNVYFHFNYKKCYLVILISDIELTSPGYQTDQDQKCHRAVAGALNL